MARKIETTPEASVLITAIRYINASELVVIPQGVGKGSSLQLLKGFLDPVTSTVVFADSENDLDMVQYADYGVAMDHAPAALKKAADFVIDYKQGDGVADFIETWSKICL